MPRRPQKLLAAAVLVLLGGCDPTYHARLDDGRGLGEGSPVHVSGVRVGEVQSVRVIEGQVDVEWTLEGDHEVTVRTDSCAMAVPREGEGPALVVVPGEGEPLEEERPIPQCELGSAALGDVMRGLGEGLGNLMEELGRGLLGGGGPGGGGGSDGGGPGGSGSGGSGGSGLPFPF
ncbi:MAG TPA: MCE family protein, partial [Sandaracinaceae bacterium LLY-WYZ-13_1]|nr:MCE family protein [Sandaracinaceae bacterium LLY-WYZ-13_1]